VVSDFIDRLVGMREPGDPLPRPSPQDKLTIDILYGAPVPRTLSDAREKHFELGMGPKNKIAQGQFERAWSLLLEVAGDVTLENLRRDKANEFVLRLVARGSGAETIKKYLSQVRTVMNTGIREFELTINNPFDKLAIPNRDEGPRKPRDSFSMPELDAIQRRCREVDDERRWAIEMISDSMTRLAEIAGLSKEDVLLDASIPHIRLRPTEERRLKNKQSERLVPLVGAALRAARKAMHTKGPMLFPVFAPKGVGRKFNANTASAALNKWLQENGLAREGQTIHSFRHTMRDRLRNVEAPADLADRIGGWQGKGVGETYGQGHSLELMQKYLLKTVRTLDDVTAT
jgi:integrase